MKEITNKTFVVLTRNTGKFMVTKDQAESLVRMINSPNPRKIIQIDDDQFFATADFIHVVPAWKEEEIEKEKLGNWKCDKGSWHAKYDVCKCRWGMDTSNTRSLIQDKEISQEQKERSIILKELIEKGYRLANLIKLKGKTNEELKIFLENYK